MLVYASTSRSDLSLRFRALTQPLQFRECIAFASLAPFYCLDLLASIVSMSRHSMLEYDRSPPATLDTEAFKDVFVEVSQDSYYGRLHRATRQRDIQVEKAQSIW